MRIINVEKSSVVDYPPNISAVVFLAGCNMRCPFCYNHAIIDPETKTLPEIPESEFFAWLGERVGKLGSICISGGEPCLNGMELPAFLFNIKNMGFKTKLDTNGSNPNLLSFVIKNRLVDFIAMDVKSSPKRYDTACGIEANLDNIDKSIRLIIESKIDHEFRTTVHPRLHDKEDLLNIAKWIKGAKLYSLQQYVKNDVLDKTLNDCDLYSSDWLNEVKTSIESLNLIDRVQIKA